MNMPKMAYFSKIIHRVFCLIVIIAGLLSCNSICGQNSFELIYSTPDNEEIIDGVLHSSGNVYLVGRKISFETMNFHTLILKVNAEGTMDVVEWQYQDTIGYFPQLLELENNNIMLIGQCSISPDSKSNKRWLRIIDSQLNVISDHFYFQDTSYISVYQNKAIIDYDGNIVVLGVVQFSDINIDHLTSDFFMAKYSQDGQAIDFKVFPFANHIEEVYDLTCIPGTDQYLAVTSAFFIGMPTPQIVRISNHLDLISNISFTNSSDIESPCDLDHWLSNSTYLLSSLKLDWDGNNDQVGVFKADTSANIINSIELGKLDTIDYPAWFNSSEYINDTTIYIGGFINYITFWTTEPSFVELYLIDTNLNLLGYRQFGGDINYLLYGITATADGGCLLYTSTYSDSNFYQERDIHIFKVPRDSIEIITHIYELPDVTRKELHAFPNPVKDVINIPFNASIENIRISLYKSDGKKIMDISKSNKGNLITIDMRNLPSGVYIYNISSQCIAISSGKFIKL